MGSPKFSSRAKTWNHHPGWFMNHKFGQAAKPPSKQEISLNF
jgi:hypothetical protein